MTDNEIVKAIERLKNTKDFLREKYQEQVKNCPYPELKPIAKQTYEDNKKAFNIAIKALEEFNRQKAEIEKIKYKVKKWKENYECSQVVVGDFREIINKQARELKTAKAEAYKEFAEMLKQKALAIHKSVDENYLYEIDNKFIDNLVKEMVGDDK